MQNRNTAKPSMRKIPPSRQPAPSADNSSSSTSTSRTPQRRRHTSPNPPRKDSRMKVTPNKSQQSAYPSQQTQTKWLGSTTGRTHAPKPISKSVNEQPTQSTAQTFRGQNSATQNSVSSSTNAAPNTSYEAVARPQTSQESSRENFCDSSRDSEDLPSMSTQRSLVIIDLTSSTKQHGHTLFEPNYKANRRLQEFSEEVTNNSVDAIVREYNRRVKPILPIDAQCISHKNNKNKNRYPDIYCLDATRVILRDSEGQARQEGDYIHASYVSSDELRKCYILTQGPKNNTINEFWYMVWQVQCPVIIMLCDFMENGKSKCMKYLPRSNCELNTGGFLVRRSGSTLHSQGTLIESQLTLIKQRTGKQLHLKHWRWTGWPDHAVPNDFQTVFRILRECRRTDHGFPIIHCSAGIGRSGTLIALEVCLGVLRNGKSLSVKNCVETVRRQRAQSVQNSMQYLFIHRALIEMAGLNDFIDQRRLKGFRLSYDRIVNQNPANSSEGAINNNNNYRRSHDE